MQETFICHGCGQSKPANIRLKNQRYCGSIACQRLRKGRWHAARMQTDATYRAQQRDSQKEWREQRPARLYQREYRQQHPDYVEQNRYQQRRRNGKRKQDAQSSVIVKMDALKSIESLTYLMTPFDSEMIVKMDPLLVELKVLQTVTHLSP